MFGLFRNKTEGKSLSFEKRFKTMKLRRINFVDDDYDGLCEAMKTNGRAMMRLKPVNYYAIKSSYITGSMYSEKDFSESYIRFEHYIGEDLKGVSEYFPVEAKDAVDLLAKVGIMIDLKKIQEENHNT